MSAAALPRRAALPRTRGVTVARSRSALRGVLLALIALLTMTTVSTWHGASVHDDDAVHLVLVEAAHAHTGQDHDDLDGAVHLAAHMIGQSVDVPAAAIAPFHALLTTVSWSTARSTLAAGLAPPSLLRPPQR